MAEILLFHHVRGRTPGMAALADRFTAAGHTVHLPDLFDGRVFDDPAEGSAYAQEVGFDTIIERGRLAAEALPRALVYAGVSLGVLPAQQLTQTRLGARGALLVSSAIEPSEFDAPWPQGVPVQVHAMEEDPMFVGDGDLDAAQSIVETVPGAELFLYPGSGHLFTELGGDAYDAAATDLFVSRATAFLANL
jgi:dienelactone hydrolase